MKTVPAKRRVIEGKLLTALYDKDKVAALLTRRDLDMLIRRLDRFADCVELRARLIQLREEAFG